MKQAHSMKHPGIVTTTRSDKSWYIRILDWFKPSPSVFLEHAFDRMAQLDQRFIELQKDRQEALEKLHLSESRFKALSEAGTEAIMIHRDYDIVVVNDTFEELTGYTEKEMIQDPGLMWKMIPEEYHSDIRRRVRDHDCSEYDMYLDIRSGGHIPVEVRIRYVEYNGHGVCRAVIFTPRRDQHAR